MIKNGKKILKARWNIINAYEKSRKPFKTKESKDDEESEESEVDEADKKDEDRELPVWAKVSKDRFNEIKKSLIMKAMCTLKYQKQKGLH